MNGGQRAAAAGEQGSRAPSPESSQARSCLDSVDGDAGWGVDLGKSVPEGRPVWERCSGLGTRPLGALDVGAGAEGGRWRKDGQMERWKED